MISSQYSLGFFDGIMLRSEEERTVLYRERPTYPRPFEISAT